jgi:hypothetical protein
MLIRPRTNVEVEADGSGADADYGSPVAEAACFRKEGIGPEACQTSPEPAS